MTTFNCSNTDTVTGNIFSLPEDFSVFLSLWLDEQVLLLFKTEIDSNNTRTYTGFAYNFIAKSQEAIWFNGRLANQTSLLNPARNQILKTCHLEPENKSELSFCTYTIHR